MLRVVKKRERVECDAVRRLCLHVRSEMEITQGELAYAVGVHAGMVQRIEQGLQKTFPRKIYDALLKMEDELKKR